MEERLRNSGIDIVGDVPWGTHFCQFYQTKEDLMDILVPYFKVGLENNEFCMWVTQSSEVEEAKEALRKVITDVDVYFEKGQIEIIPYGHGYVNKGISDSERVLNGWVKKLDKALSNGYDGLRLTENILHLEKKDWGDFADYEEKLESIIGNYQMMVLCTYSLDRYNATEIIDVVSNHQFTLIKKEGKWEQIESSMRKKAEEKIQSLANIVESSYDAIITKSLDGIITSWNKGAEQIYGYSAKEVLGKPISILDPSRLVEETKELIELIIQGDRIHHYETLRLRKDGTIINVSLTLSPVFDASGELTAISVIARDITKSKRAEEKLRENEERYRLVTEQTGQVVYEYDLRTDESSWAGAIEEVTGYSFEELQKFGKDFWIKNIHRIDMNHVDNKFPNVRMAGNRFREELRLRRKDGTCIYVENNGFCLMDHEGQPYGTIGILKDITEKREAKEALNNIEIARKKEIHHRIKNNLQVISSLLDLQAEQFKGRKYIKDLEVLEAFKESQDRVISMALIHEELHEGEGTDTLNFSLYLEKLVENFLQTYSIGNTDISLNLDLGENIFFDMDTAVPLGMIVNELISNSFKYAFPERKSGEIKIKLSSEQVRNELDNKGKLYGKCIRYILVVSDNGVGIPKNIDFENSDTLGLQLVSILVDQLDGKTELKRDKGTEFIISFSVEEKVN